jgi:hypothetical protein
MNSSAYFGTIVSGGNVKIRGVNQSSINAADRGTIVVRGNVNMELQRAALAQLALQAQNIYMNLVDDLLIRGIVQPVLMPDGSVSQLINLQQLGRQLGFLTDGSTFAEQGSTSSSPTGLVPMSLPSSSDSSSSGGFSVHPTAGAGFMGPRPSSRFFIPAMQNTVLNQLITMILTPIYGRSILLNLDSTGQLMRRGATIAETFRGTQSLILPDGDPAILFDKSSNPDVEVEIDGEKTMVPLYDSFLLTDVVSRLLNKIKAEKLLGIQSLGDIRFEPGEINLESEDIILKSKGQIQIAAQYVYNETGNRVGVNPVSLSRPGTITLSGDKGVKTQGAQISAQAIKMASSDGSIVDSEMPLDPTYSFSKTFFGGRNVTMRQKTFTSSLAATEGMSFSAPRKSIDQHGTNLITGPQGILFDAPKYTWQPAFEEMGFYHSNCDGFVKVQEKAPKMGGMQTPGAIVFKSQDTTLMGAQIIAGTVSNPVDGQFRVIPAYATQESHSLTNRSGFLSHSSLEIQQTRSVPVPTQILAEHFESLGVGVCELEGAVVRALDMTITKTLEEKAAYERSHTVITQKASGFCPPKIKGDPFIDALKGMRNVVSFGDVAPATFNLIGATAQTLNHAQMLANLSTMGNPLTTITQILTSRFIAGPSFCNIKTVTKVDESKPLQSRIETGILRVTNDRTHLEGEWDVSGRGEIDTGKFSMSAPRHTVTQTTETSGWSVSLSPAALLGAYLDPCLLTGLGCLPNVAVHESDGSSSSTSHAPTILRADDLFIRCGDAVFSGAQIHARLLEAIVTGDLTVESLADEFRSESESRDFGLCLGAIASLTQEVKPDAGFGDPRLGAVPTMRFANEDAMSLKVREVAQMVGQERFYLTVGRLLHKKGATVGLKPDGVVVRDDAERIQAGRTLEEKVHEAESHHRTVINPAIGEFVAMMNQVDDLLQLRAQITQLQMLDGVPKPEREKTNREVKEFLDKPEVKEKIAKLKVARQKQKLAAQELRRLEMEDPTLPMRMAGIMPLAKETPTTSSAKSAPKIAAKTKSPAVPPLPKLSATQLKSLAVSAKPMAKKSPTQSPAISVAQSKVLASTLSDPSNAHSVDEQMNRVFAWSQAQQENKSCGREAMEMLSSINESLDKFAVDHKNIAKVGAAIVEGIGYAAVGGALLVAAEGGILPFVLGGSTMLASNEVVATVLEHGSEYVVKEAASLGTTEAEAVRFGTNMAGTINKLMFLGATKLAVKVVKGGKGTVKTLSPKESTAISKQAFREKQTNPIEFNASVSKGISEAVEKNPLMKLEMERFADAANQRPYNSRAMESLLQARYPDTVSSHTLPGLSQPNVGLAGMHKERFIGHDPLTFEPIIQRVTFDQRGFPVFDPYVKVETRISGDLGSMRPDVHMKMATAQLKADIDAGRISRSMFNDIEWTHIQKEKPKIGTFTWHHHQETGRMQLVPTDIHDWVGHIGGNKLWGMPK